MVFLTCFESMMYSTLVLWFFFLFFLPLTDLLFLPLHMGTMSHGCPCDSF